MSGIGLSVGGERKSIVLIQGLGRKPLFLLGRAICIGSKKSKSVEISTHQVIVQLAGLRLLDDLSHLVESLQGQPGVGEIGVPLGWLMS
jgi:hypothetical protein